MECTSVGILYTKSSWLATYAVVVTHNHVHLDPNVLMSMFENCTLDLQIIPRAGARASDEQDLSLMGFGRQQRTMM